MRPALASPSPSLRLTSTFLRAVASAAVGALALSLASQVRVPLWNTGVPLTAQPQMVLLLAALLGPARATAALCTWYAAAASGLPVLAGGGGVAALIGPSCGFLFSYLPVVACVGRFGRGRGLSSFLVWQAAGLVTLALGTLALSAYVGPALAVRLGWQPFWLADGLKVSLAFLLYRALPARLLRAVARA